MHGPTRPSPLAILVGAILLAFIAAGTAAVLHQQSSPFSRPNRVGGPFTMSGLDGRPVTQADLVGKPTALFFGFTQCPDVCPTTLATLSGALGRMGDDAARLNVVFVSLDPERDTPEVLRTYLDSFDPRIRGLVGTPEQVARMADAYHIVYRRVAARGGGDTLEHTAGVSLFDRTGRVVGEIYHGEDEAKALAKLITLAFPRQCHPGGGVSLWATDGARVGACRAS